MREKYWKAHNELCTLSCDKTHRLGLIATMDKYVESLENKLKTLNEHLVKREAMCNSRIEDLEFHGVSGPPTLPAKRELGNIRKIRSIINATA